jgi:hypothetical protein
VDTHYKSDIAGYHCADCRVYPQQKTTTEDRKRRTGPYAGSEGSSCGQHEVCERDSLLAAVSKKIEYYDDEELDQFIGREGNMYTEEETEQFRDVLYTTKDDEVAGWIRSLQLRGIELPDNLKDEVFLIIGERRI